jgi:hypothetical protein
MERRIASSLIASAITFLAAPLVARPTNVPWSGCAPMVISKTHTGPYSEAEVAKLECFYVGGSIPAGLELAKHYQNVSPPEYGKARKVLVDLAKGTKVDASSIEARGATGGRQFAGAKINSDGSISPVPYRDPSPVAQREIAKMMLRGQDYERDVEGADGWLKKAIKGGDAEAKILRNALVTKGFIKP